MFDFYNITFFLKKYINILSKYKKSIFRCTNSNQHIGYALKKHLNFLIKILDILNKVK